MSYMENKDRGYISLYRSLQEHFLYPNHRAFTEFEAWVDILFTANHKAADILLGMEKVKIERGTFVTSEQKLSIRWLWGRDKVRNFLKMLQKDCMIIKNSTTKFTMITICNYDNYQQTTTTKQQRGNNGTTTEQQRGNTNNNENNVNNENKEIKILFDDFWNLYDKKTGKEKCILKWNSLTEKDKLEIIEAVPKYTATIKDKKYQKNPLTYLSGKYWKDEIKDTEKQFYNPFEFLKDEKN